VRGRAFAGVALGATLALAASAFAVTTLADDGPSSPEAAVEALFAAVEARDVLGVLDTMEPAERGVYQPFVEDAVDELQRLRVLSDDLDLGSVGGFEIDVEGLELESEQLAEGVAVVRVVGGTITSTVDPARMPVGDLIRRLMDDPDSGMSLEPETSTEPLVSEEPVEIVVLDDGGWHVSLHYSIAEAARKGSGAPLPVFGAGVVPDGEGSPEEAVRAMVEASVDLDLRRVIALLPPGEMSALHDYAPLFLDDADEAVAELRAESDFEITVDRLDLTSEVDDGVGHVTVDAFAASGQVDGDPFEVAYDGACFSTTIDGESDEVCVGDEELGGAVGSVSLTLTILAVERDGAWFVTPTRTLFEHALVALRAIDPEDLEDPESLFGSVFGLSPFLFGVSSGGGDASSGASLAPVPEGDDPSGGCSDPYLELPADADEEDWEVADRAVQDCDDRLSGDQGGRWSASPDASEEAEGA
jgi:hypothetical protein